MIIYKGPSEIDGDDIVAIITGDKGRATANRKTGPMGQLWILRLDTSPVEAVKSGANKSVCGSCPIIDLCYVNVGQAPGAVWRAFQAGSYAGDDGQSFNRPLRFGAYGDPAALPLAVLLDLKSRAEQGHTGYTHRWRERPELRGLLMASCETAEDERRATAEGWRFFSTAPDSGGIECPNYTRGVKCADCGLCNGAGDARSIFIAPHGSGAGKMLERAGKSAV